MAISKFFLELFGTFVNKYNTPTSSYWSSKDTNADNLIREIGLLYKALSDYPANFEDKTIIDEYNAKALQALTTDRYFFDCWLECFTKYNEKTGLYTGLNETCIRSGASTHLATELLETIQSMSGTFSLSQKAHQTEIGRLKTCVEELTTQKEEMTIANSLLVEQVAELSKYKTLQSQIEATQKQLQLLLASFPNPGSPNNREKESIKPQSIVITSKATPPTVDSIATSTSSQTSSNAISNNEVSAPVQPPPLPVLIKDSTGPLSKVKDVTSQPAPPTVDQAPTLTPNKPSSPIANPTTSTSARSTGTKHLTRKIAVAAQTCDPEASAGNPNRLFSQLQAVLKARTSPAGGNDDAAKKSLEGQ